jgi:hypothetical protein
MFADDGGNGDLGYIDKRGEEIKESFYDY